MRGSEPSLHDVKQQIGSDSARQASLRGTGSRGAAVDFLCAPPRLRVTYFFLATAAFTIRSIISVYERPDFLRRHRELGDRIEPRIRIRFDHVDAAVRAEAEVDAGVVAELEGAEGGDGDALDLGDDSSSRSRAGADFVFLYASVLSSNFTS